MAITVNTSRARSLAKPPRGPKFASLQAGGGAYAVILDPHGILGEVRKQPTGVWTSTHRDGTPGPGAWSRIDAAWALINS